MSSELHTIASYNMSFASDLGKLWGSEKHFISDTLKRLEALGYEHGPRAAWERAADLVIHFWKNQPYASAIGLQEMNTTEKVNTPNNPFAGGVERMKEKLENSGFTFIEKMENSNPDSIKNLASYSANVQTSFGYPTLLTIWDSKKLGTKQYEYVADLGYNRGFTSENRHKGRPITIVYTTEGFTLINLHSPNWSEQSFDDNMRYLRKAINAHVTVFLEKYSDARLHATKLFVMGDFNDPFTAIKYSAPLVIKEILLYYNNRDSDKIKSCCYNFDSACPIMERNPYKEKRKRKNGKTADELECYITTSKDPVLNESLSGNIKTTAKDIVDGKKIDGLSIGARGHLKNYQYTGDYVMGHKVHTPLQIYRPDGFNTPYSLESDHEMVLATFESNENSGGARRKQYTRRKKPHNKYHKKRRSCYKKYK